jgi:hypothetical protein
MRLKRKIPTFIFGVSIGLAIGSAFFIFKVTDVFNKLKDAGKASITVIEQPVKNIELRLEQKQNDKERFKINIGKTAKVDYSKVDSLIHDDSEINVATDELLSVKNIKLIKIDDNISYNDTLASKLAHVAEDNSNLYFVEFWKTPLNSKGYRFSKNKIMLYGFIEYNNVLLYEIDNSFYLKSSDQVYRLFYGGEFRQLEKVMDSDLLARLN